MAEAKHAPRETWHLTATVYGDRLNVFCTDLGRERLVATLISGSKRKGAQFKADAQLLATAPELLTELREFVEPYAEVTDAQLKWAADPGLKRGSGIAITIPPQIAAAVLRFRAAIAKAEGRA